MSKIKQKQQKRREEIVASALGLLTHSDFDDISVSDICRAADISIGSFYHYFTSKNDVLVGLMGLIDIYMEDTVLPLLTSENEAENLRCLAHHFALHVQSGGIERSRVISGVDITDTDISGGCRLTKRLVTDMMRRGQQKGQLTSSLSAERLSDFFMLSLRGVTVDWTRRGGGFDLVSYMDEFIGFSLGSYMA